MNSPQVKSASAKKRRPLSTHIFAAVDVTGGGGSGSGKFKEKKRKRKRKSRRRKTFGALD